jgi:hypothetical protein
MTGLAPGEILKQLDLSDMADESTGQGCNGREDMRFGGIKDGHAAMQQMAIKNRANMSVVGDLLKIENGDGYAERFREAAKRLSEEQLSQARGWLRGMIYMITNPGKANSPEENIYGRMLGLMPKHPNSQKHPSPPSPHSYQ